MHLRLTPKFILTFFALAFVMHEAHEIVHTSIGRLICGCWGQRDFNAWELCKGCSEEIPYSIISTFAGPIFTFIMIWIGVVLMSKEKSVNQQSLGFSFIFANMPFARILTAAMGGGDEVFGLHQVLKNHTLAWAIGLLLILAVSAFPLYKAFTIIQNKRRMGWFLLFFLLPTFIDLLLVLGVMNTLLENGVLKNEWILGSPILVTVWTVIVSLTYFLTRKNIYELTES